MGRGAAPFCGAPAIAAPQPTLADWRDLLALVLRGRCRRALARLGLISPETHLALLEAEFVTLERLHAAMAAPRANPLSGQPAG